MEKIVCEFEYITPEPSDIIKWCFHKMALHACELLASDQAFSFPNMYRRFMKYLADYDVDLSGVSKSRLVTFLGNEFGELVTSFCVDRCGCISKN